MENNLINDLANLLENKKHGFINREEIEEVEKYLGIDDSLSEEQLIEIRNNIVRNFDEEIDKIIVYTDEEKRYCKVLDKDRYWFLNDVMSASVMVVDCRLYC